MKFFGNGLVWDKQRNCVLCRFTDGEFETVDKRVAEMLTSRGYKSDGLGVMADNDELEEEPETEFEPEIEFEPETEIEPEAETVEAEEEGDVLTTLDITPRKARR